MILLKNGKIIENNQLVKKDVLIVSANSSIQVIKGNTTFPTGELLYKLEMPEAKRIVSTPSVFDFDKDNVPDVLFGTEDGRIVLAKVNLKRREIEIVNYFNFFIAINICN